MKFQVRVVCLMLGLSLVSTCTPSVSATETPSSQNDHPLDTRTGTQNIDPVLAAVASHDPDQLRALIHYTTAPCTTADGLGGPPKCSAGEADGTMLEVLPVLGSEGGFIRRIDISTWSGVDASAIYAVYRGDQTVPIEQYYPAGDYAVIYISSEHEPAISLRVADGGIVRLDYLFTEPEGLRQVMDRDSVAVILAPKDR